MAKTVAFATLGCKVNQYETEGLAEQFARRGYDIVPFGGPADVYVVNTCTVTHIGDKKSRQLIRRARRANPAAFIVATGCYAQVAPDEVEAVGADLVVGTRGREHLAELVDERLGRRDGPQRAVAEFDAACVFEELPISRTAGRARAYIKVQEGCRDFCTYCIVPHARGPLRSRPPERVLEEAARLVAHGYVEIVLTGTHLGAWGRDLAGTPPLADLVSRVAEVPGLLRLRLSSIEPLEITPALVGLMASSAVICPHLHIPLQSGDDEVLRRMGRRYTTREYALLVEHARSRIRDLAVTTDVMVGFPGETEEQFARSLAFVRRTAFSGLHVFKYSPRRGTPAAAFPAQVPAAVKEKRSDALLALDGDLRQAFASRYVGRTVEVLVEEVRGGRAAGLTGNYLRVSFPGNEGMIGRLQKVRLLRTEEGSLTGAVGSQAEASGGKDTDTDQ
ncbi:MAG: tRNA (N(6)-L-threonylcarbamoyladenosine(37)-C(2))-methylthiotransferase MtaB [Bacillota bacterium]|nr:tRNA (N(6)-L-threonylcarbamoyladenosine(37)-C(2))-methylthiotransferase MtaB [Bacillota bacterium]